MGDVSNILFNTSGATGPDGIPLLFPADTAAGKAASAPVAAPAPAAAPAPTQAPAPMAAPAPVAAPAPTQAPAPAQAPAPTLAQQQPAATASPTQQQAAAPGGLIGTLGADAARGGGRRRSGISSLLGGLGGSFETLGG